DIGIDFFGLGYELFGGDAGSEIEDLETAGGKNGGDQVLANIVNISACGAENDFAESLALGTAAQHLGFKNLDGSLHRLGRSKQIGQKHLATAELIAGKLDAHGKSQVDGIERIDSAGQRLLREFHRLIGRAIDDALEHRSEEWIGHWSSRVDRPWAEADRGRNCTLAGKRKL